MTPGSCATLRELGMPGPSCFLVRAFLSLVLSILLPFRRHSRSLLPTGPASLISYCAVVIYILYEARLEFALVATASLNYGLRPVVDYILYGAKLEFVLSRFTGARRRQSLHFTITAPMSALPPRRLMFGSRISSPHSTCPFPLPPFDYITSKTPVISHHHLDPSYRGIFDRIGATWQEGWFPQRGGIYLVSLSPPCRSRSSRLQQ